MGEHNEGMEKLPASPIESLARLIARVNKERLYIEQQNIYPIESQKAARILPAMEESIENRLATLTPHEADAAHRMADLISKSPSTLDEPTSSSSHIEEKSIPRAELLSDLDKIANDEFKKEEQ